MQYQFTFTSEQAQALWACIQNAPLARNLTDELAQSFRDQVAAQNREREAEAKAQANGHEQASLP